MRQRAVALVRLGKRTRMHVRDPAVVQTGTILRQDEPEKSAVGLLWDFIALEQHSTPQGLGPVVALLSAKCSQRCRHYPRCIRPSTAPLEFRTKAGAAIERLRLDYRLWATRRMPIVQHAAQHADALDRAIIALPQTADNIELVLGLAHHFADIDIARRATQADAAPTTAHGIEIALPAEIAHDLRQMLL